MSVHGISRRQFIDQSFMGLAGTSSALGASPPSGFSVPLPSPSTEPPRELYRGVYQIASLFGGRNLFQYLFVGDNVVLLDTGIARTPAETIFPAMARLRIRPEQLTLAVTTHADGDHQGGNDALKRACPHTLLSCGVADRAMVEDPRTLWDHRYNFLKEQYGVGIDSEPSPDAGKPRKMDLCLVGGETICVREGWSVEVLHVPGHSHGHLALYDPKQRAAFIGDAIHGRGCPKASGGMAIPVTYYYVDVYLSTLTYLESLPLDVLYTAHWPERRGKEIGDFIAESRQTVELFDRVILASLAENPAGLSMKELIDAVGNAVGDWPKETWIFAMFPVKGHMDRLEEQGKVRPLAGACPVKWQRV